MPSMKKVLLLSLCVLFLFSALLHWLEHPIQSQIEVMTVDILALFSVSE